MADRVSIQCPGCLAKLNLSDRSKLGKKIKCPKCSDIFVATEAVDEDLEDLEDEAPSRPVQGRRRPGASPKGGAKKGKSSQGSNAPLIAGGIIGVVALLLVGLYASGMFGGAQPLPAPPVAAAPAPLAPAPVATPVAAAPVAAPAPPPAVNPAERTLALRWLPEDTELLVHVKVSDLWQAPLLQKLVAMPEAAMVVDKLQQASGVGPADIESVTLGFSNMQAMQQLAASQALGMPATTLPKVMAVVRTKKPLSLDDLLKNLPQVQPAEHGSKKFFQSAANSREQGGGWIAEPTTLVLAPLDQLKSAMDRGQSTAPVRQELLFADSSSHVILLFAPKDPKSLFQQTTPSPLPLPPQVAEMQQTLGESATAFGLGINIRGGIDLQTSLLLKDRDSAGKLKTGFDIGIAEGKTQFEAFKASGQPLLAELGDLLLTNLKVESQSQVVKVSTSLPDSAQQKIEQLPPLLMMMAMAGGIGGGNPFGPAAMRPGDGFPSGPPGGTSPGGFPGFGERNPGETKPVAAEVATGIPDGTTLSARTSWSAVPSFTADGKSFTPMQVILDLNGDAIDGICGFGQASITTSALKGGGTLKVSRADPLGPNLAKAMVPFDAAEPSPFEHPEGTLRLTLNVDAAPEKETTIATLEGSFKILTSDESEEFTIADAPKTAKRPLTDPKLKAAGVKLIKSTSPFGETLTLSCGKNFFLGKAKASDPADANAGGVTMHFSPEFEKNQPIQRLQAFGQDSKLSESLQVQFKIHKGVKEQTVTFKFVDVPLPTPESKPRDLTEGQPQQPGGAVPPGGPSGPTPNAAAPAGPATNGPQANP